MITKGRRGGRTVDQTEEEDDSAIPNRPEELSSSRLPVERNGELPPREDLPRRRQGRVDRP